MPISAHPLKYQLLDNYILHNKKNPIKILSNLAGSLFPPQEPQSRSQDASQTGSVAFAHHYLKMISMLFCFSTVSLSGQIWGLLITSWCSLDGHLLLIGKFTSSVTLWRMVFVMALKQMNSPKQTTVCLWKAMMAIWWQSRSLTSSHLTWIQLTSVLSCEGSSSAMISQLLSFPRTFSDLLLCVFLWFDCSSQCWYCWESVSHWQMRSVNARSHPFHCSKSYWSLFLHALIGCKLKCGSLLHMTMYVDYFSIQMTAQDDIIHCRLVQKSILMKMLRRYHEQRLSNDMKHALAPCPFCWFIVIFFPDPPASYIHHLMVIHNPGVIIPVHCIFPPLPTACHPPFTYKLRYLCEGL